MSPFSIRIRHEIISSFPEWESLVVEDHWKGSDPYVVVAVPPPSESGDTLPLKISTWNEEVTVGFDYYHSHFDSWLPQPGEPEELSALSFVQALLQERVAIASWWLESALKASTQHVPGEDLVCPLGFEHTKARVRSWRGSHNVDRAA